MRLPKASLGLMGIDSAHIEVCHELGGVRVFCELRVRDVNDPERVISVASCRVMAWEEFKMLREAGVFKRQVKDMVMRVLEHEVDEWLRLDGELVTEPRHELP